MPEHLIRFLHALYAAPADGVADAELLARVAARDDAAFELLVRRHAALVWRTCRAVARDHHAAEDAFQATFLALATKSSSVRGSVAGWLYRVAYHAALKARKARGRTGPVPEPAHHDPVTDSTELAALLHDELARLPDRYRDPVVLCHLHGVTQTDAAKQLGLPVGTVATNVRRGLDRLRSGLASRGVAPAVGLLAAVEASAAPPVARTVPAHVTRLSEGALSAMTPTNWKPLAASVVATLGLGLTVAFAAFGPPNESPPPAPAKPTAEAQPALDRKPAEFWQARASLDNLRKIGIAIHGALDDKDRFPRDITDKDGKPLLSWRVAILPFLDQRFLHAQFKLDEPWNGPNNRKLLAFMPDVFRTSVQDVKATETYYKSAHGVGAVFDPKTKVAIQDISDGTSVTLLVAEAGPPVPWTAPLDIAFDPDGQPPRLAGPYTDATHVALADGAPYRLNPNPDPKLLRRLILRSDAEAVQLDTLMAAPAKPVTDAEHKQVRDQRAYLVKRVQDAKLAAEHRFRVEQEIRRQGGTIPFPDPSKLETLEELEDLAKRINDQTWVDQREMDRLLDVLRKTDPRTAARLDKEYMEARIKAAEERKD